MAIFDSIGIQSTGAVSSQVSGTLANGAPPPGSIIVAVYACGGNGTGVYTCASFPFSATPIGMLTMSSGPKLSFLYRVAGASEPSSYTFATASSSNFISIQLWVLTGRNTVSPFTTSNSVTSAGTTSPVSIAVPGITAAAGDDLLWAGSTTELGIVMSSFTAPGSLGFATSGTGYLNTTGATSGNQPSIGGTTSPNFGGGTTGTMTGSVTWSGGGTAAGLAGGILSIASGAPAVNYSYVNQLDYSTTVGATTISSSGSGGPNSTIALAQGNFFVAGFYNSNTSQGSMSDNLGNAYTPIGLISSGVEALTLFAGVVTHPGNATVSATSTNNIQSLFVEQYAPGTGYVISVNPTVISGNYVNGNATGANAVVAPASAITIPAGTYLLFGFNFQLSGTVVNTTGTTPIAFTGRGNIWEIYNGTIGPGIAEDTQITSTGGTYQVTFGSTTIRQVWTMLAAFQISSLSFILPTRRVRRQIFTTYYPS